MGYSPHGNNDGAVWSCFLLQFATIISQLHSVGDVHRLGEYIYKRIGEITMKTLKQTVIDEIAEKVKQMGYFELLGWPPSCLGTFYQPERPFTDDKSDID